MNFPTYDSFMEFAKNVSKNLEQASKGQVRRKANWVASVLAQSIPNTSDDFNINTLKDCLDKGLPIPTSDTPKGPEYAFKGSELLPPTGIYLLWNVGDEAAITDIRIVTRSEYESDPLWSKSYRYWKRVRRLKSDKGFDELTENLVSLFGVEALILEVVMTYGILTEDAQWRLTNDIKRLNISDWGDIKNTPKYPHTLEYFGPMSDFDGRSAREIEKEAARSRALETRQPVDLLANLTRGSDGWDAPEED